MNYEKAYKKALERAKKVHKYSSDIAEIKRMEDIFPELVESEDERISREITEFILTHRIDEPNDIEDTNPWLAWLEKQGEKPQVDGFDAELNALLKKYEHLSKKELQEPLEFYLGVVRDDLDVVREEEKPKWTEEDEAHLHSVTTHLEQWIERHPNTCGADIQGENLAWLKGIKQRMEEKQ